LRRRRHPHRPRRGRRRGHPALLHGELLPRAHRGVAPRPPGDGAGAQPGAGGARAPLRRRPRLLRLPLVRGGARDDPLPSRHRRGARRTWSALLAARVRVGAGGPRVRGSRRARVGSGWTAALAAQQSAAMTAPAPERRTIVKVVRRLLAPAFTRIDAVRDELAHLHRRWDELAARIDQLSRQTERLEAYQQVSRDEVRDAFASLTTALEGTPPDAPPGEILQRRLDHALLHAEALTDETRRRFERELAELRSAVRLAQALAERGATAPPGGE